MKYEVEIETTVEFLAKGFCDLDDDAQARFFVEVAREMSTWSGAGRTMQAHYIGAHLRECACSTLEARDFIEEISFGMRDRSPTHHPEKTRESE